MKKNNMLEVKYDNFNSLNKRIKKVEKCEKIFVYSMLFLANIISTNISKDNQNIILNAFKGYIDPFNLNEKNYNNLKMTDLNYYLVSCMLNKLNNKLPNKISSNLFDSKYNIKNNQNLDDNLKNLILTNNNDNLTKNDKNFHEINNEMI